VNVDLPDGSHLRITAGGDAQGLPVVVQSGTPGGGLLYREHVRDAEQRGLRLIGYDRPGYGGSTRRRGRVVADAAGDVAAIADTLRLDRFAIWGVSGGGPHALACAALLPGRVVAVATLASVAPFEAEGLDWFAGMGPGNLEEFAAAQGGVAKLAPALAPVAAAMAGAGGATTGMADGMRSLLTDVDVAVLDGPLGAWLFDNVRAAVGERADGWVDDDVAFVAPWGFEVGAIGVPALLWQGGEDRFVPPSHGAWLAERIPGVDARLVDDDGHLTLLRDRVGETHDWLREHF
jgi:pimeloyl-ACP methyl ester carboxylesterase